MNEDKIIFLWFNICFDFLKGFFFQFDFLSRFSILLPGFIRFSDLCRTCPTHFHSRVACSPTWSLPVLPEKYISSPVVAIIPYSWLLGRPTPTFSHRIIYRMGVLPTSVNNVLNFITHRKRATKCCKIEEIDWRDTTFLIFDKEAQISE